ncbi:hypothetical protein EVAR_94018_1 [Eumeta japonica]|uniref:Uncharacterized protein n=1 Tax=Eumeta variegata TaxID=151549 RepID=A0A4C2A9V5_EUMVA|nr:hypothetical protein EVAR_94018_1 [Eumeta japonica]
MKDAIIQRCQAVVRIKVYGAVFATSTLVPLSLQIKAAHALLLAPITRAAPPRFYYHFNPTPLFARLVPLWRL